MPLISVVVATYNQANYLPATVSSVLAQTFRDFELIVIDDGSTDSTAKVLEPFQGKLRYIYQQNTERGAARNHGLRLTSGKYVGCPWIRTTCGCPTNWRQRLKSFAVGRKRGLGLRRCLLHRR